MYFTLPSLIIQSRLDGADVTLRSAFMQINADTSATLNPEMEIFAPQALLSLPLISYTATIPPFRATVSVDKTIPSHGDSTASEQVELGVFESSQELQVDSSKDLSMRVAGVFTITGKEFLGDVVNHFIKAPVMAANMKASLSISATVWGWLPVYLPSVSVHYKDYVPAMDNFRKKDVTLDEIVSADGQPNKLTIGCTAFVYNPSPAGLIVNDHIQMRVFYQYLGQNYSIGRVSAPSFRVNPGDNTVNGTLVVEQTLANTQAIIEMITAYMGGLQHGFNASATKPFQVTIRDDGENSAHSEMLRNALNGLDLTLKFQPQPLNFLQSITSDVCIFCTNTARVNLLVFNPLPQSASVLRVNLLAYQDSLSSNKKLYKFDKNFTQDQYIVPPQTPFWVSFDLTLTKEVIIPSSWGDLIHLTNEGLHREIYAGVDASLEMLVHPSYKQTVRYTNEKLSGYICFHAMHSDAVCGSGAAAQRLLPTVPSEALQSG
jgi:hypothetical protein